MSHITISCPHCGFFKDVEAQRVPAGAKNIRCPKCQQLFDLPVPGVAAPRPSVASPSPRPAPREARPTAEPVTPRDNGASAAPEKFCSACGGRMHVKAMVCSGCGTRVVAPANEVSKGVLLLITFFFGGIGGHKFYLKRYLQGVLYILFIWTGIPGLIALVEFILYIFKDEAELKDAYPEVNSAAFIAVFAVFAGIIILGILAAIAIPQFATYRDKAYTATVIKDMTACNAEVLAAYKGYHYLPVAAGQLECKASPGVALYYIAQGPEAYQLIAYHDHGQKAYTYSSGANELSESLRQEMEQQIKDEYGLTLLERRFHFVE